MAAATISATVALSPPVRAAVTIGDCGWQARSNPSTGNVLYPDEDAVYYVAQLPAPPPGLSYRIRGRFPHARYMSFVAYNGLPVDAVLDADIVAEVGSTNPFVTGADRTAADRSYTVPVVAAPAPADRAPGTLYLGGGQLGSPTAMTYLFYRIYVTDDGADRRGGVGLPAIELADQGTGIATPCEGIRDASPTNDAVQNAVAAQAFPATLPVSPLRATDPPSWELASGLTATLAGRAGMGDLVVGGPGSNPHNTYVVASVSQSLGSVFVVKATAPTAPRTRAGSPVMEQGDLRYWSFCQNSRSTRYVDCLSDEDVVVDADGAFTIVFSTPADRPAHAENWVAWGPEPDAQVIYRHMLPSAAFFPHSAQGASATDGPIASSMADYFPGGVYCSTTVFEANRCGL